MENKCIITGEKTKGRLEYNKSKTKIPLSKDGKKILDEKIKKISPYFAEELQKNLKSYFLDYAKLNGLEPESVEKMYDDALFGGKFEFNLEGVRYQIINTLRGKAGKGVIGINAILLTKKYIPELSHYLKELYE